MKFINTWVRECDVNGKKNKSVSELNRQPNILQVDRLNVT